MTQFYTRDVTFVIYKYYIIAYLCERNGNSSNFDALNRGPLLKR